VNCNNANITDISSTMTKLPVAVETGVVVTVLTVLVVGVVNVVGVVVLSIVNTNRHEYL